MTLHCAVGNTSPEGRASPCLTRTTGWESLGTLGPWCRASTVHLPVLGPRSSGAWVPRAVAGGHISPALPWGQGAAPASAHTPPSLAVPSSPSGPGTHMQELPLESRDSAVDLTQTGTCSRTLLRPGPARPRRATAPSPEQRSRGRGETPAARLRRARAVRGDRREQ